MRIYMNKSTTLGVLASVLIIAGCGEPPRGAPAVVNTQQPAPQQVVAAQPTDTVLDIDSMEIYAVVANTNKPDQLGKYIYWVRDGSNRGWTLYSNKQYSVGDTLAIGPTTTAVEPSTNIFGE